MTHSWIEQLAGKFIVFDGADGSGKSTQFDRFGRYCADAGVKVCEVREPGGTSIGEQIRGILLSPQNSDITLHCEMLLYMASRAQLIEQRIRPALQRGELVLADRFISSTLAYQGTAGGMSIEDIMTVGAVAVDGHWPDLTVVFDVDERVAATRLNPLLDRMELKGVQFHRQVRQGYLDQVARGDLGKYLVVDASVDEDKVFSSLLTGIEQAVTGAKA